MKNIDKILNRGTTLVSLALATAVMWAKPFGADFDQADADVISTHFNEIVASVLATISAVSRGVRESRETLGK